VPACCPWRGGCSSSTPSLVSPSGSRHLTVALGPAKHQRGWVRPAGRAGSGQEAAVRPCSGGDLLQRRVARRRHLRGPLAPAREPPLAEQVLWVTHWRLNAANTAYLVVDRDSVLDPFKPYPQQRATTTAAPTPPRYWRRSASADTAAASRPCAATFARPDPRSRSSHRHQPNPARSRPLALVDASVRGPAALRWVLCRRGWSRSERVLALSEGHAGDAGSDRVEFSFVGDALEVVAGCVWRFECAYLVVGQLDVQ